MFAVRAPVLWFRSMPWCRSSPPAAVQVVEFVELHFSCEEAPDATLVGDAVSVTVGHGITVLPTFFETVPPSPVQFRRKVTNVFAAYGPRLSEPESGFVPLHALDATQLLAFVVDHFSENTPFTDLLAVKVNVGGDAADALFDKVHRSAVINHRD